MHPQKYLIKNLKIRTWAVWSTDRSILGVGRSAFQVNYILTVVHTNSLISLDGNSERSEEYSEQRQTRSSYHWLQKCDRERKQVTSPSRGGSSVRSDQLLGSGLGKCPRTEHVQLFPCPPVSLLELRLAVAECFDYSHMSANEILWLSGLGWTRNIHHDHYLCRGVNLTVLSRILAFLVVPGAYFPLPCVPISVDGYILFVVKCHVNFVRMTSRVKLMHRVVVGVYIQVCAHSVCVCASLYLSAMLCVWKWLSALVFLLCLVWKSKHKHCSQ